MDTTPLLLTYLLAELQARDAELAELRAKLTRRGRAGRKPLFERPLTQAERNARRKNKSHKVENSS